MPEKIGISGPFSVADSPLNAYQRERIRNSRAIEERAKTTWVLFGDHDDGAADLVLAVRERG